MKPYITIFYISSSLLFITVLAQEIRPYRPAGIPANDPALNSPAEPEFTSAEMATPPVGQIKKSHLRTVNQLRAIMTSTLAAVPAGSEGTGSTWFTKAQRYKAGLDTVALTSLQADCFSLIPKIKDLLTVRLDESSEIAVPSFAQVNAGLANGFSTVLIHAIERHIIDQSGVVPAANVIKFCTIFCTPGFLSEGDWEASPIPVDSAGIIILDAEAIVTHLKSRPWQEADQFLGNETAVEAFARYTASGDGMAILKAKYATNEVAITSKWNELTAWVAAQRKQM